MEILEINDLRTNMYFSLDIFIKEDDLEAINITEELVNWGSDVFSRMPPRYSYKKVLVFEKNLDMAYYQKYYAALIGDELNIDI